MVVALLVDDNNFKINYIQNEMQNFPQRNDDDDEGNDDDSGFSINFLYVKFFAPRIFTYQK